MKKCLRDKCNPTASFKLAASITCLGRDFQSKTVRGESSKLWFVQELAGATGHVHEQARLVHFFIDLFCHGTLNSVQWTSSTSGEAVPYHDVSSALLYHRNLILAMESGEFWAMHTLNVIAPEQNLHSFNQITHLHSQRVQFKCSSLPTLPWHPGSSLC